jgi:hypothetical protein
LGLLFETSILLFRQLFKGAGALDSEDGYGVYTLALGLSVVEMN